MLFEGNYDFEGIRRYDFGWGNPNEAGAFIASLLVGFVAFSSTRKPKLIDWSFYAIGGYALALTGSRGALVSYIVALVYIMSMKRHATLLERVRHPCIAIGLLSVAAASTTLLDRLASTFIHGDRSSLNRIMLWKGAADMMWDSPITGWGANESGKIFCDWYQPAASEARYVTMVSSVCEVGVAWGIIALWLLVALTLLLVWHRNHPHQPETDEPILAARAIVLCWFIANCISTIYRSPALWILPVLGIAYIMLEEAMRPDLRTLGFVAGKAMAIAALLVSVPILAMAIHEKARLHCRPLSDGAISVGTTIKDVARKVGCSSMLVLTDTQVLGVYPGKTIQGFGLLNMCANMIVYGPGTRPDFQALGKFGMIVLVGRGSRYCDYAAETCDNLMLYHPLGTPPKTKRGKLPCLSIFVALPGLDIMGYNDQWKTWAERQGAGICEDGARAFEASCYQDPLIREWRTFLIRYYEHEPAP
jgi:hypothetical protein